MLGMKYHPDGYSVGHTFESLCTEEGTVEQKDIFEGEYKFAEF